MSPRQGRGSLSIRGWQQGDIHCSDYVEKTSMLIGKDVWMGLVWLWLSEWWWLFWDKNVNRSVLVLSTYCRAPYYILVMQTPKPAHWPQEPTVWCQVPHEAFLRKCRPSPGKSQGCSGDVCVEIYGLPLKQNHPCWAESSTLQRDTALHLK